METKTAEPTTEARNAPPPDNGRGRGKSLAELALIMDMICNEIDESNTVPLETVQALDDMKASIGERTDAWIARLDAAEMLMEANAKRAARAVAEKQRNEALVDRIKAYLLWLVDTNPGVLFKGETGKLTTQKNGGLPTLSMTISTKPLSHEYTLTEDQVDNMPGVAEFVELDPPERVA